jgi:hypothetical protein
MAVMAHLAVDDRLGVGAADYRGRDRRSTMADSKRMNPYGVGYAGATVATRHGRCVCCGLAFRYVAPAKQGGRIYCDPCLAHLPPSGEEESIEHRATRLAEDNVLIVEFSESMKSKLNEMQKLLDQKAAQVRSALRTRAEAEGKVRRIMGVHGERLDGSCECGTKKWPCETIRAIRDFDPDPF